MTDRIENNNLWKRWLKRICIFLLLFILIFTLLRVAHIVVKIGKTYKLKFSSKVSIFFDRDLNDNNVHEIVYMKNLEALAISGTSITNLDFLKEFDKLEYLHVACYADCPIRNIPSLKNIQKLSYVELINIEIENLAIFSELTNIEMLTVLPINTKIHDISGIKNLQKLRYLAITGLECEDHSVLFELPNLTYLKINNGVLTQEEMEILEGKGVKVVIA